MLGMAVAAVLGGASAHPPMGSASNGTVEVAAVFQDAAAVKQLTGSDFTESFAVIEVTVTPRNGRQFEVQPDDFLMRVGSSSDSSGPMVAAQILGAGGGLVLHREKQHVVGTDLTTPGNTGVTEVKGSASVSKEDIAALQGKLLSAKTTKDPVTGLLFFPIGKKKPRDLDLVYSTPEGKLHISFR